MNVVSIRPLPTGGRIARGSDRHLARVETFDDMARAEPHWRALELVDSLATPYQRYDFLKHWQRHVGSNSGMTPFIVVGFNQESEPIFLLPLGSRPIGGLIGLEFLGGKHANFNMALWRRDVAATIGEDPVCAPVTTGSRR
jgi:CelD/BcsL family acetyltransferase involved in cellulose biosynthesis